MSQFGERFFVIVCLGIAKLDRRFCGRRKSLLNSAYRRRFSRRHFGRISGKLKHIRHKFRILLPRFLRFCVVLKPVIAVGQADTALRSARKVYVAVLVVCSDAKSKKSAQSAIMKNRDLMLQVFNAVDPIDLCKKRLDRCNARFFHRVFVHTRCVIIANELRVAARGGVCRFSGIFDHFFQDILIILVNNRKTSPTGILSRYFGSLQPVTVCILIKIVTSLDGRIHPARIKTFALGQGHHRHRKQYEQCR